MPQVSTKRVVIGAQAHLSIIEALRRARPDLELRGSKYTDVTADDLAWGDTYIGFRRPPLETMGNIRWVHCTGAGVDAWLLPVELSRHILLTRTTESFGPMIAEWALARALAFSQQLLDLVQDQQRREWKPRDVAMLRGTTAVVVGTGDVGTHVGRLFRGMGCTVLGVSRSGAGDESVFSECGTSEAALAAFASRADWLICTLPLTRDTRGLIGRDVLGACRNAVLLNAGRGAVVDEASLPLAFDQGWLRGAALDVFETEPLPLASPLWMNARVMISPHISGITTTDGAATGFLECLETLERGEQPRWVVDRDRQY